MLRCYNLPRTDWGDLITAKGHPPMFWSNGWGSPYRVYLFTNQLVAATAGLIEDRCTTSSLCQGFGGWFQRVLKGHVDATNVDTGPCKVQLHFRSADAATAWSPPTGDATWYDTCPGGESVVGTVGPSDERSCSNGFKPSTGVAGRAWDQWDLSWDESRKVLFPSDGIFTFGPNTILPNPGTDVLAHGHDFKVVQHPSILAATGVMCDYLLFLGRLAYDYYRATWSASLRPSWRVLPRRARTFARYALRLLAERGRLLIHELGHTYTGGGHCGSSNACCFEYAARLWESRVVANMGLPALPGYDDPVLGRDSIRFYLTSCQDDGGDAYAEATLYTPDEAGGTGEFACRSCEAVEIGGIKL